MSVTANLILICLWPIAPFSGLDGLLEGLTPEMRAAYERAIDADLDKGRSEFVSELDIRRSVASGDVHEVDACWRRIEDTWEDAPGVRRCLLIRMTNETTLARGPEAYLRWNHERLRPLLFHELERDIGSSAHPDAALLLAARFDWAAKHQDRGVTR